MNYAMCDAFAGQIEQKLMPPLVTPPRPQKNLKQGNVVERPFVFVL